MKIWSQFFVTFSLLILDSTKNEEYTFLLRELESEGSYLQFCYLLLYYCIYYYYIIVFWYINNVYD